MDYTEFIDILTDLMNKQGTYKTTTFERISIVKEDEVKDLFEKSCAVLEKLDHLDRDYDIETDEERETLTLKILKENNLTLENLEDFEDYLDYHQEKVNGYN